MSYAPTLEQAAAISSTAREVLLRAGAGSGKTSVLVDRYCDLIARHGLTSEQILAFTFTRKAAAQLRERVRRALLQRAATEPDPEAAARLREAANRIGTAWIMTIHSFCQAVIAGHPVAAGIDPDFTVIQDLALDRLRDLAFERALERFLADPTNAPAREELVAAYGIENLRHLILDSYDELRSHGEAEPVLPEPADRDDPDELLRRLADECSDLLAAESYRPDRRNHDKIVNLREVALRARESLARTEPGAGPHDLLTELEANCFNSEVDGKREVSELAKAACRALHEELVGLASLRQLSQLLSLFGAEFSAAKARRSALDFDDLQLLAVRLLTENPAIGDGYRDRFRQIMVDEFQDTSPVQVALIEALKGPETSVFQVGDKFQAIYAFRHADLANFDRVDHRLRSDPEAEVLPLSGNFRSSSAVLAAVNGLAADLLPGFPPLTVGSPAQEKAPRGGGSGVELIVTAPAGWDDAEPAPAGPEGVSRKRAAEAEALAHRLGQLAAAGVPRGDMVVLLRALSQADAYATALDRAGLRPFVVDGRGFWQGREVIDAVALLRAVANPLDEEGLFGALAGPACAASPDALWLLRRAAGRAPIWQAVATLAGDPRPEITRPLAAPEWLSAIEARDRDAIRTLYQHLIFLRAQRAKLGLADLVETALTRTGLDLAALAGERGAAGLAALRKLSRLAAEFEAAERRDLRGFLDYARLQAKRNGEAEAPIAAEGHDGVRIMTMHAAKGLEFPVVAVPELGRRFGGGSTAPAVRLMPRPEGGGWLVGLELARLGAPRLALFDCAAIKELERRDQEAEELRLFYVAMTRAKERLILSGQGAPPPKDGIGPLTPVLTRLLDLLGIEIETDGPPPAVEAPLFPPAAPRPDLEAEFGAAKLDVRFNWPEPEHRLALTAPPPTEPIETTSFPTEADAAPPPTFTDEMPETATDRLEESVGEGAVAAIEPLPDPPAPLPPLSFTGLIARERREPDPVAAAAAAAATDDGDEAVHTGFHRASDELGLDAAGRAYGVAIHGLLERAVVPSVTGARWRPVTDAMIARALAEQGLSAEGLPRARRQIDAWLGSPLCAELSRPGVRIRTEVPLLLQLEAAGDATLRGWIDLLAEPSRGPALVVDYKTNRLDGRRPSEIAAEYRLQAEIYALAVSRALATERVEVAFVFLDEAEQPVRISYGPIELAIAETELSDRIASLRARTAEPDGLDATSKVA